jgi:hypothetical protein
MSAEIPEPVEGTIVAWWDEYNDLRAVAFRTDQHIEAGAETYRWYFADNGANGGMDPMEWWELLTEMQGFRGPSELVSHGRLPSSDELLKAPVTP